MQAERDALQVAAMHRGSGAGAGTSPMRGAATPAPDSASSNPNSNKGTPGHAGGEGGMLRLPYGSSTGHLPSSNGGSEGQGG